MTLSSINIGILYISMYMLYGSLNTHFDSSVPHLASPAWYNAYSGKYVHKMCIMYTHNIHIYTPTCTCTTHAYMCTHIHTCVHTCTYIHTQHTHTHIHITLKRKLQAESQYHHYWKEKVKPKPPISFYYTSGILNW